MTNKLAQYLYVYDKKNSTFPERWKVVDDNDKSEISAKINGHITKQDLEETRESLKCRYSDVHYIINSSYGNSWEAVQNNYPGLFYNHFSTNKEGIAADDIDSQLPFVTKIKDYVMRVLRSG